MTTLEQIEYEISERVRKQIEHFMKVEQHEAFEEGFWDKAPKIKPVHVNYDEYSDYPNYFDRNIKDEQ